MIKVPFSLAELDIMAQAHFDKIEDKFDLSNKLHHRGHDVFSPLFDELLNRVHQIIKGRPDELERQLNALAPFVRQVKDAYLATDPTLDEADAHKKMKNEVLAIFNYDTDHMSFTKRYSGRQAYEHTESLKLNCCPYCNAQFTFTIRKGGRKTRPVIDHFYGKSEHPYLALSFYNLVPACYVCNSNLKGSDPFLDSTHLHPFVAGFEQLYQFRTKVDDADFVVNKKDFDLKLEICEHADAALAAKAKLSADTFAIDIRYENHKDIASELITKSYYYNNSRIKELALRYKVKGHHLFHDENEVLELVMSNVMSEEKMHTRVFSKLTRDVCDEFNIRLASKKKGAV